MTIRACTLAFVASAAAIALASESSADPVIDGNSETRRFRLVPNRLEAARMQNARIVRITPIRGERDTTVTFGLSLGSRAIGLSELNGELERNGYSTVGTRTTFGLAGGWFGRGVFLGMRFEGGPQSIRSAEGIEGNVGFFDVSLRGGPVFGIRRAALIYPFVGIGGGVVNVLAQTADSERTPILRGRIPSLRSGFDANSQWGIVEIGLGSFVSLPIVEHAADRYGVAVGTELGYSVSFAEGEWRDRTAGPDPPSYAGPSSHVHGANVRLLLQYAYDGFSVTWNHEVLASCEGFHCDVRCDDGFADCDADPGNGCETEVGTVENCGGCGDACGVRHGSGVCSASRHHAIDDASLASRRIVEDHQCAVAACNPGFMNCNGWISDGCETPTLVDSYNCGACGRLCTPLDHCVSGACVPKRESDGIR